jgi:hypothetical protein
MGVILREAGWELGRSAATVRGDVVEVEGNVTGDMPGNTLVSCQGTHQ